MKITNSSDWRGGIPFSTPVVVSDVAPGEATRCFVCGPASEPRERTELWVVKHKHPNDHGGYVRFYCSEHVPAPPPPPAEPLRGGTRPTRTPAERREAARRPAPSLDITRAMCPDCFVEVSATGKCGMCGVQVS